MNRIDERAAREGIVPLDLAPRLFVPVTHLGTIAFVSGHTSDVAGTLGGDLDLDAGRRGAREAIVRLLSSVLTTVGSLDAYRFGAMRVYVASSPGFGDQPAVADAASEIVHRVFGPDRSQHARAAIGVAALPRGVAVEIEAVLDVVSAAAHGDGE